MFYVGLYWENMKKIFLSETTRPRALIFSMQHHLMDLYQICSNYAPRAINRPARGSHVLHRLVREKHENIFLFETTRPRALLFSK